MSSISKLSAAQDPAAHYLEVIANERDDYYLGSGEAPGRWIGGGLLRFLPVHRRADADLELAHPTIRGGHSAVGITARRLEGVDQRCPAGSATAGEALGLEGDDAVDFAGADQLQQFAELGAVRAPVLVSGGGGRLDALDHHVDLQPLGSLPARLDLHVEGRGTIACDRLACMQSRSTSRGHGYPKSSELTNAQNTLIEAQERAFRF